MALNHHRTASENASQIFEPIDETFYAIDTQSQASHKLPSSVLKADLIESESGYKVIADLPGVDVSDIHVTIEHSILQLRAERQSSHHTTTDKVHALERTFGRLERRFQLPRNADMDHADTTFNNGVLTVTFPKLASVTSTARRIAVTKA